MHLQTPVGAVPEAVRVVAPTWAAPEAPAVRDGTVVAAMVMITGAVATTIVTEATTTATVVVSGEARPVVAPVR